MSSLYFYFRSKVCVHCACLQERHWCVIARLLFHFGFCFAAQAGLELNCVAGAGLDLIFLPLFPEFWDSSCAPPHLGNCLGNWVAFEV